MNAVEKNTPFIVCVLVFQSCVFCVSFAWGETPGSSAPDSSISHPGSRNIEYTAKQTGTIRIRSLTEASGLAQSRNDASILWSHNDASHGPVLYAFDTQGVHAGRFHLDNATSRDWEDIAAFTWNEQSWLAVADTGDNSATKKTSLIHLLIEPVIDRKATARIQRIQVSHSIVFEYPDGPADCESIGVDVEVGKIFLLTKRADPPRLYSLPLVTEENQKAGHVITATYEGELRSFPKPSARDYLDRPIAAFYRSQPTAMDISADRSHVIVNTYGYAYRFERDVKQSWIEALNNPPLRILMPLMKQPEALAISLDGQSFFVTSEGKNPPIFQMSLKTKKPDNGENAIP